MPHYDRSAKLTTAGDYGFLNVLFQDFYVPGEVLRAKMNGMVKVSALREQPVNRAHYNLSMFIQPVRWCDDNWAEFVKAGPGAPSNLYPKNINILAGGPGILDRLGLGGPPAVGSTSPGRVNIPEYFVNSVRNIYNQYYKFPSEPDLSTADIVGKDDKLIAVPLPCPWSRGQDTDGTTPNDVNVPSATTFDVRTLETVRARFRNSMEREWTTVGSKRYQDVIKELFGAEGSREVDRRPILISDASMGREFHERMATDGPSIGEGYAVGDFSIDHNFGEITLNEHYIMTVILTPRFESVHRSEFNPLAFAPSEYTWAEIVGDPGLLASMPPQQVRLSSMINQPDTSVDGRVFLPAGWQYRARRNVTSPEFQDRDTFPFYRGVLSKTLARKADTAPKNAFSSTSLRQYHGRLNLMINSDSPIPPAASSVFTGSYVKGRGDDQFFIDTPIM
jgi:hypothetical protein